MASIDSTSSICLIRQPLEIPAKWIRPFMDPDASIGACISQCTFNNANIFLAPVYPPQSGTTAISQITPSSLACYCDITGVQRLVEQIPYFLYPIYCNLPCGTGGGMCGGMPGYFADGTAYNSAVIAYTIILDHSNSTITVQPTSSSTTQRTTTTTRSSTLASTTSSSPTVASSPRDSALPVSPLPPQSESSSIATTTIPNPPPSQLPSPPPATLSPPATVPHDYPVDGWTITHNDVIIIATTISITVVLLLILARYVYVKLARNKVAVADKKKVGGGAGVFKGKKDKHEEKKKQDAKRGGTGGGGGRELTNSNSEPGASESPTLDADDKKTKGVDGRHSPNNQKAIKAPKVSADKSDASKITAANGPSLMVGPQEDVSTTSGPPQSLYGPFHTLTVQEKHNISAVAAAYGMTPEQYFQWCHEYQLLHRNPHDSVYTQSSMARQSFTGNLKHDSMASQSSDFTMNSAAAYYATLAYYQQASSHAAAPDLSNQFYEHQTESNGANNYYTKSWTETDVSGSPASIMRNPNRASLLYSVPKKRVSFSNTHRPGPLSGGNPTNLRPQSRIKSQLVAPPADLSPVSEESEQSTSGSSVEPEENSVPIIVPDQVLPRLKIKDALSVAEAAAAEATPDTELIETESPAESYVDPFEYVLNDEDGAQPSALMHEINETNLKHLSGSSISLLTTDRRRSSMFSMTSDAETSSVVVDFARDQGMLEQSVRELMEAQRHKKQRLLEKDLK
ncbi:hypothetical protein BDR26DRAFT_872631 [Obelidium mucronatum]|nr:hypothetical protein BDR26DRAFT_872631 [Obelidium mucronatum]